MSVETTRQRGIRGALQRLWSGERGPVPFLLGILTGPMAVVFGTVVRFRNALFDAGILRSAQGSIPVVSIGNLAVGGSGKTPVSAWLLRQLRDRGWKPALVVRGYGEDEVLLHRAWNPDIPVIRAPRRAAGVDEAAAAGRDIVVLDDGFQHRWLRRDLDIVLLSPAHPLPVRLLPRGPFREPLRALRRADRLLIAVKGSHEAEPGAALAAELHRAPGLPPVEVFTFGAGRWKGLDGQPSDPPEGLPLVVCSVAQPAGFAALVEEGLGGPLETLAFPDHHRYEQTDVASISQRAGHRWIATTEKDAVKLAAFRELLPEARVLPLVAVSENRLAEALIDGLGVPGTTPRK